MTSTEIRRKFLDFFRSKEHHIVTSAPVVVKDDPTLMFTNAGMNQFKDIFLGHTPAPWPRVADTQKCLRVSGKHNDLEEVGFDTYHHTMFEMLGNWSFGDYFKKEAIAWAWELLTEVYGIDKDILYVTVFKGDEEDGIDPDHEALECWKAIIPGDRILYGSKKDNFWEMGETGPCGPCSEIHADIRSAEERRQKPGHEMVNAGHPEVIEIWNLVFIEFNRQAGGTLDPLPARHVDTGMGFERLCMVMQGKKSNYDTDIFQSIIQHLAGLSGITYGSDAATDVAMRVIADHLRAVSFAIADGQLPSNAKAGYVIRRILRRAVRFGYSYLGFREPFINQLVPVLVSEMGATFPEIRAQQELVSKVIAEEEASFLRTLVTGIQRFDQYVAAHPGETVFDGSFAFELFDTYGFPLDLTQLMAREKGMTVDMEGFSKGMDMQKSRSRQAASVDTGDWVVLLPRQETDFVGWDTMETEVNITRYRKVRSKNQDLYQLVFDTTPFYAEAGGQVGDTGYIENSYGKTTVINTIREHKLVLHLTEKLPDGIDQGFTAVVDREKRISTMRNHSATHLMHKALREVLGRHVEQKGSLVDAEHLRFDFSHFQKLSPEEIRKVEEKVNQMIRGNLPRFEDRNMPMADAQAMGAMALFGEKYGDTVRVIRYGPSVELCGGTHVSATGEIGFFKIISEGAIAAGVRRIEAITGSQAEAWAYSLDDQAEELKRLLKAPKDIIKSVTALQEEVSGLRRQVAELGRQKALGMKDSILKSLEETDGIRFAALRLELGPQAIKDLAFELMDEADNLFLVIGNVTDGKPGLSVVISENLAKARGLDAAKIVRELAKEIQGGGGGQPFYATAGGKNPDGLERAIKAARSFLPE